MFLKIFFLFSISSVLANQLRDTPEDLKEFFNDIDTQVKALQHETMIQLRTNVIPLDQYITAAQEGLVQNMSNAALPYWAKIRSLEETAAKTGQDITACLDLGNNQFNTLNQTLLDQANQAFENFNQLGNDILNTSETQAYGVIQELIALEQVVVLCTDETCATTLKKTVTQYYERTKNILDDAETKARNFVFVYLPVLLLPYSLDENKYVADYTVFLNDISSCIDNL